MDSLREFSIPFKSLKDGLHNFNYSVDKRFFSAFENSMISDGQIAVNLSLDKRSDLMVLDVEIDGFVWDQCDRCLADIPVAIEGTSELLVKFAEETTENDEIIYLSGQEHELRLANYLYEIIHIHLPIRKLRDCKADGYSYCDQKVLEKLKENESEAVEENPLWDSLKNIEINN